MRGSRLQVVRDTRYLFDLAQAEEFTQKFHVPQGAIAELLQCLNCKIAVIHSVN